MRPALIANENVPAGTIDALRAEGFDVQAVVETHRAASDRAVLAVARQSNRWLLTFDRDYGELIFRRAEAPPPAIIFLRQRPGAPRDFADWIRAALSSDRRIDRIRGHLAALDGRGVRLRRFPASLSG